MDKINLIRKKLSQVKAQIEEEIEASNKRLEKARPHDTLLREHSHEVEREEGRIEGLMFALDLLFERHEVGMDSEEFKKLWTACGFKSFWKD